jgi:hypothetical protein
MSNYILCPGDMETIKAAFKAGILYEAGPMAVAIPLIKEQMPKLHTALLSHKQSEEVILELFDKPFEELQ